MNIALIDYGAGNLFSVQQAFRRIGVEAVITADPTAIRGADRVVFPGVGHADTAMKSLQKSGLDRLIPSLKQPVLGICLGMQLLCESTEEGAVKGLGIFRTEVVKLDATACIVPHMGWNDVVFSSEHDLDNAYYFVHSYKALISEDTWATCDYEYRFAAALKRQNFWGVQFHPEKSGDAGERLLKQFLNA